MATFTQQMKISSPIWSLLRRFAIRPMLSASSIAASLDVHGILKFYVPTGFVE
ncbi:TPA: hypothetical protein NBM14_005623 [Klebsiella pneumoniae]|nr:hypothetical protein [Klebsiella pneumoniae]